MFFNKKKKAAYSLEDITPEQQEILNEEKRDMIQGIEELSETAVKEVMIPRIDVDFIAVDTPLDELMTKIRESEIGRAHV